MHKQFPSVADHEQYIDIIAEYGTQNLWNLRRTMKWHHIGRMHVAIDPATYGTDDVAPTGL